MRCPAVHSERDCGHLGACQFSFRMFSIGSRNGLVPKRQAASGTTGDGDPTQCCSGMIFQKVPRIRLVEPEYGRFETIPGKLFQNGMSILKISAFLTVAKFAGLRLPL